MSSNGYYANPTTDLASILRTLASLTPQNPTQIQIQSHDQYQIQNQAQNQTSIPTSKPFDEQSIDQIYPRPIEALPPNSQSKSAPTLEAFLPTAFNFNSNPQKKSVVTKNIVDPTCILEWPAGILCITNTVAKNENILDEIRKLLKLQHEHEEQWWNGRNALIEKLKAREEGQKKLDEVLKAVGGVVSTLQPETNIKSMERELQTFDLKVYKAQMQMVREMNAKLRTLGVPFFGTRSDLVRPATKKVEKVKGPKEIDEADLVKLQRRMLEFLEDLCNG
ncbi:hypothetical protein OnM2_028100 [Erysiphe neolycopersici]|uniref:Uncharacterized protein n=1 Tax=Erysiphe neolycopersici TaxID=212602 RepID=A0A420I037_9PEZI|nr:hypothetical protein OnM2_028100 [Erysiphe neolycopersici]